MDEPTCSQRDAASVVFNLPGYDVIEAFDLPLGGRRRVVVQAIDRDEGCPDCGVISTKVHAWVKQQVRDIPAGGNTVEVVVRKRCSTHPSSARPRAALRYDTTTLNCGEPSKLTGSTAICKALGHPSQLGNDAVLRSGPSTVSRV